MKNNWGKRGLLKEGVLRRGFTVFHFYRIQKEDRCTQVYLGYYVYISQKQLLKSSTRSDRWLSKLDLKKDKSKYHVKDHAPVRKLRPTIPTTCHKSNNWWNCFSFTSVGLPLYVKFPLGDRRLFPLFGWTDERKPVCSVGNTDSVDFWRKQDVAGHVMQLQTIFYMKLKDL